MSVHFEETLICHCAATLARHKCGSLFAYAPGPGESLEENLAAVNARLAGRGVQARLMKRRARGGLIDVYRPDQLAARLAQPEILAFLKERGYAGPALEGALETLAQKAKFSQHTLTAEELEQFTAYLTDARHQLEQKPLYLRLVYMYLYAVI